MDVKQLFANELFKQLSEFLTLKEIEELIEVPKNPELGDLAFPCFTLAKKLKQAPPLIASNLAENFSRPYFSKVSAVGPYLNVFIERNHFSYQVVQEVLEKQENYGNADLGLEKTIIVEFSSPNIAKPFSMGHLRSTVIGNALEKIAKKLGFHTVKINHLGDWGTQFGKLITAYIKWGDEEKVKANPIEELLKLYTKFHVEVESDPTLDEDARQWFKKLEDGNEQAQQLWTWFKEESLKEFKKIYELLGIKFDSWAGESFYSDKMNAVIDELKEKGLLEISDEAEVVNLSEHNLPPCLVKKSDGATLYATRDLAAAFFRKKTYNFEKALYVVGHEQSVHFQQIKAVIHKMGYEWAKDIHHIPFGLYLQDGKKMSTRKGRVILLEDVLNEVIQLAEKNIAEKNPNLATKKEVAKIVGIGAVVIHDLKNFRMNNIEFSMEDMLTFEGDTGPYVQYTFTRACSILRKSSALERKDIEKENIVIDDHSWEVIKQLYVFPEKVIQAYKEFDPSIIAKYVLHLARDFNKYYSKVRILEENEGLIFRLQMVKAVTIVLEEGLRLLGIQAPEQM